jgi:hypothetical protein
VGREPAAHPGLGRAVAGFALGGEGILMPVQHSRDRLATAVMTARFRPMLRKLIMAPEGSAAPARKPNRDETLVKALVRANRWRRRVESGSAKSIADLAEQEGVTVAYACHSERLHW